MAKNLEMFCIIDTAPPPNHFLPTPQDTATCSRNDAHIKAPREDRKSPQAQFLLQLQGVHVIGQPHILHGGMPNQIMGY